MFNNDKARRTVIYRCTHHVWRARSVRVRCRVRVAAAVVVAVRSSSETAQASQFGHGFTAYAGRRCGRGRRRISFVDHEINGHFALQATDVTMTEIVAQFVDLYGGKKNTHFFFFKALYRTRFTIYCIYWRYRYRVYNYYSTSNSNNISHDATAAGHTRTTRAHTRDEGPLVTEDREEFPEKINKKHSYAGVCACVGRCSVTTAAAVPVADRSHFMVRPHRRRRRRHIRRV